LNYITEAKSTLPESFPVFERMITTSKHGKIERFYNAITDLRAVLDGTQPTNKTGLDLIKRNISAALDGVWDDHIYTGIVLTKYMWKTPPIPLPLPEAEASVIWKMNMSLIEAERMYRKYAHREKQVPEIWGVIIPLLREIVPIKAALDIAKTKLVVGRVRDPNAPVKQTNPNQIRGTCTWCDRNIALTADKKMTHHGYQRPGWGEQTRSCDGIMYKCGEVSDEGYRAKLKVYTQHLTHLKQQLAALPSKTMLEIRRWVRGGNNLVTINKSETPEYEWAQHMNNKKRNLESDIGVTEGEIATTKSVIKNWKPVALPKPRKP
jgi:hypothetical protein